MANRGQGVVTLDIEKGALLVTGVAALVAIDWRYVLIVDSTGFTSASYRPSPPPSRVLDGMTMPAQVPYSPVTPSAISSKLTSA
jgi:hypothetical protein